MPKRKELANVFAYEEEAQKYLLEKGVFYIINACPSCGNKVSLKGKNYRCTKDGCRKSICLYNNSFFAGNKLKIHETLELAYYWLANCSYTTAHIITGHSPNTITAYYSYFRQLVTSSLEEYQSEIGGPGIVVEIDESKFGKRKYNRGHRVEGAWVFGGIERTPEKRFFTKVVEKRDEETLLSILNEYVAPGSIVYSDCWRAYKNISNLLNIEHATVNHSLGFVDKEYNIHTNTIEAKWGALKRKISLRGRVQEKLDSHLMEHIWRAANKNSIWDSFIESLKSTLYQ